ncbi:MAG: type VI secretion system accessory protein TagJ [Gemmataceae bacterium]|nr:tetratricopeptide repeat protein [Gemmata sp.]MDW8199005.1 type VI secretion system accessory protein TagJ [Gemmataceae bacterium]
MTVDDLLAEGRLAEALAQLQHAIAADPANPQLRRQLIDLLFFMGRFRDISHHLAQLPLDDTPAAADSERRLHRLLRSERQRSVLGRPPRIFPEPPPPHASRRQQAWQWLRRAQPEQALHAIDAADARSPMVHGFIDGRPFDQLRDADDRFASVLEVFWGGEYLWVPWEALHKVVLAPPAGWLDQLYRPAVLTLRDGSRRDVDLPLVYPASYRGEGVFALGLETDYICPDRGPTRCLGGKLLIVGDDEEQRLADCHFIEVSGAPPATGRRSLA